MAFTFQINDDVVFNHDERLLAKAEANRPVLKQRVIQPTRLVDIIADEAGLNGYLAVDNQQEVARLTDYPQGRDGSLVLDFGDHQVGHFSIDIDSVGSPMDAPLYLRLKFAEIPAEIAADSTDYDGWLSKAWIQEEYIHLDTLPAHLELPRRYSFRYVELKVVDTSPKWQAAFSHPQVTVESAVEIAEAPTVALADEQLQKIYAISVKTLQDCMQTVFEDGPKRDRRLWIGDLRLQALANYATFDQRELVKRCLYLFGGMTTTDGKIPANVFTAPKLTPDDTFLFDYSLFFVSILADYQAHTNDRVVLADLYGIAKQQVQVAAQKVDAQGALRLDDAWPVFVDWSNDFNKETAGQAILIYTLKQFITLAHLMNDADVSEYEALLAKMTTYAKETLFDPQQQLFVSGEAREINVASQVWMVLAHVLDDAQNTLVMQKMVAELFPITGIATPYMYHHVVEALFEAGQTETAVQLMKDYWGKMVDLGADTFWEAFKPEDPDFSPYGSPIISSYCHAWSCTPAYLIQKYL